MPLARDYPPIMRAHSAVFCISPTRFFCRFGSRQPPGAGRVRMQNRGANGRRDAAAGGLFALIGAVVSLMKRTGPGSLRPLSPLSLPIQEPAELAAGVGLVDLHGQPLPCPAFPCPGFPVTVSPVAVVRIRAGRIGAELRGLGDLCPPWASPPGFYARAGFFLTRELKKCFLSCTLPRC